MTRCIAITRSGRICGCSVNDTGSFCGRHGGLSRRALNILQRGNSVQDLELLLLQLDLKEPRELPVKTLYLATINEFYCSICLENKKEPGLQVNCCKNGFCEECINTWARLNHTCPCCRTFLR